MTLRSDVLFLTWTVWHLMVNSNMSDCYVGMKVPCAKARLSIYKNVFSLAFQDGCLNTNVKNVNGFQLNTSKILGNLNVFISDKRNSLIL